MRRRHFIFLFLSGLIPFLIGCRQAKYVADGDYLHKSNEVIYVNRDSTGIELESDHDELETWQIEELIRPTTNSGFKLWVYNRIDTTRYNKQVEKKIEKNRKKNKKREEKEERINNKRIKKAMERGDSTYRPKVIPPKEVSLGWRNFIRTKFGEAPVIFDSTKVAKSKNQIEIFLKKQGYYNAVVSDSIIFKEKKKKAFVEYYIESNEPYRISSIEFDSIPENSVMMAMYAKYLTENDSILKVGDRLIESNFEREREAYSKYLRDNAHFGMNAAYVNFVVDTTEGNHDARIIIFIKDKQIDHPYIEDSIVFVRHRTHRVKQVTYYLYNTNQNSFPLGFDRYVAKCDSLGLELYDEKGRYHLLDTIYVEGKGIYIYNQIPYIEPELLDNQNFLEIYVKGENDHYYKDYYLERSYRTLSNLGVFSTITPRLFINPDKPLSNEVYVEYHLYPLQKQSFVIEPRATNSNSILGINGNISYQNINLARGAQKFKFSLAGGFESQPLIVDGNNTNDGFFNTWEIEPRLGLEFPQIVPFHLFVPGLSKRLYPKTSVEIVYNFQNRSEFTRNIFSFIWTWKFQQDKVQDWTVNPFYFDYVRLNKEDFFQERLDQINDPFLIYSYSDHLTTLVNVTWHFNNSNSNRRARRGIKHIHDIKISVKESGEIFSAFNVGSPDSLGQLNLFNVPYTQFLKGEGQYVVNQYINKKHRLAYRFIAGAAYVHGNSQSLPYEQSFFGGGSNDIRAFQARTMAPGGTQTFKDSTSTTTQLGDMKLEANIEWRFDMSGYLKGAVFVDAGNIWKLNSEDANDPGLFGWSTFAEQIAIGTGFGLRMDIEFLVVRLDMAFALYNPYLDAGERWFLQPHPNYTSYFTDSEGKLTEDYRAPHALTFNFGIGYPF